MIQETNPQTETLVPFTVCLPHEIAGKIIAQARAEHLLPETWLQNTIISLLQTPAPQENDPRIDLLIRLLKKETGTTPKTATLSSPDTEDVAAQELRKKFIALKDRRTRTAHKLSDTEHSVVLTARKMAEYQKECESLEEEQKNILGEVAKTPGDRELIGRLDSVADLIMTAQYNFSLVSAQYLDAVHCQKEMVKRLEDVEKELAGLEERICSLRKEEEKRAEAEETEKAEETAEAEENTEQEAEMK